MAIRLPKDYKSLTLTVTLKDGTVIGPADTGDRPFGEHERVVGVWQGDSLVVYPMELVSKVEMHFAS